MLSKILIITESMIPFAANWGSCQRIYYYAKKMVSDGFQVTVMCHNTSDKMDGVDTIEGITVIGHGGRQTTLSLDEQATITHKNNLRKKMQAIDRNVKLVSNIVRSTYKFIYSEPNALTGRVSKNWAKTVIPITIEYIEKNNIDVVILSGPTFGIFYYADEVKKTGVKLVLDYRDPWVSWYEKPTLAKKAEKKAIGCADLVVTTTQTLTAALNEKYKTAKCQTIMNGYDEKLWNTIKAQPHNPNKLIISYIGSIAIHGQPGFRDPTNFMKAAKVFKKIHDDVEIQFVGVRDKIEDIDSDMKKYIEFRNTVPVAESLELTARADVLLMFHTAHDQSGKYIICGKAFDCLRSGNYVLSIGDKAFANKSFVESTGAGIHCENNEEAILAMLESIYKRWKTGALSSEHKNVEHYSRDYQNTKFLQLIQTITE